MGLLNMNKVVLIISAGSEISLSLAKEFAVNRRWHKVSGVN